eukprot:6465320-Amphidinium_carterae.1
MGASEARLRNVEDGMPADWAAAAAAGRIQRVEIEPGDDVARLAEFRGAWTVSCDEMVVFHSRVDAYANDSKDHRLGSVWQVRADEFLANQATDALIAGMHEQTPDLPSWNIIALSTGVVLNPNAAGVAAYAPIGRGNIRAASWATAMVIPAGAAGVEYLFNPCDYPDWPAAIFPRDVRSARVQPYSQMRTLEPREETDTVNVVFKESNIVQEMDQIAMNLLEQAKLVAKQQASLGNARTTTPSQVAVHQPMSLGADAQGSAEIQLRRK